MLGCKYLSIGVIAVRVWVRNSVESKYTSTGVSSLGVGVVLQSVGMWGLGLGLDLGKHWSASTKYRGVGVRVRVEVMDSVGVQVT